ncbi:hypothetical protein L1987_00275 [Smallanthus sonchifolius]|uniref:Uncharacterized protein n=1 Tax=Smallanthus sonchifolius TaxID=185202 RepID=A0ACB9K1P8_9ASTR|nr:hypothetical protein L1987_00275 [Smallanthus sonchifolius]
MNVEQCLRISAASISMMASRLICWLLVVLLSHAGASELSGNRSLGIDTRWEILEAVTNRIHFDEGILKQKEEYGYYLWHHYIASSRSRRPRIVNEMSEMFKKIAYRDCRYDMMGLILFGPEKVPYHHQLRYEEEEEEEVNWVVRAVAVFAIFDSSFDTPLAPMALIFKNTKLQWVKLREYLTRDDSVVKWEKYPEGWTSDSVARWVSAPGFREWVIKNQDRIIVIKDD